MAVLSITVAEIKRLCAISGADTSQDDDIAALISAEQAAHEYALDPAVVQAAQAADLVNPLLPAAPGLVATLTLGVAEIMAGSYLVQIARAPAFSEDLVAVATLGQASAPLPVTLLEVKRLCLIADTEEDADISGPDDGGAARFGVRHRPGGTDGGAGRYPADGSADAGADGVFGGKLPGAAASGAGLHG